MKPEILQTMQKDEHLARTLMIIKSVFDKMGEKWFMSFGALLYFIRDRNMGVKFEQDLDITVLGNISMKRLVQAMDEWGFRPKSKIVDDHTKRPFQIVFASETMPCFIDVFLWKKSGDYWWHTYDYYGEHPKNGIPSKYIFKGTPEWAMKGEVYKYNWEEITGDMNFPCLYGSLLDIWYPGWFVVDKNFGQSHAAKTVKVKTCKKLEEYLV